MALYQDWLDFAQQKKDQREAKKYWDQYFDTEKEIYAKILTDKPEKSTVKGYAERFGVDVNTMVGFLDGINDSLKEKNNLEDLHEDTGVNLDYDEELLYKNMVEAHADWLYNLKEWDRYLSEERKKELFKEQRQSKTVIKKEKIGRNDPCPCGSGKKYKKCCGQDA